MQNCRLYVSMVSASVIWLKYLSVNSYSTGILTSNIIRILECLHNKRYCFIIKDGKSKSGCLRTFRTKRIQKLKSDGKSKSI